MRYLVIMFFLFSCGAYSQNINCKQFHVGKFRYISDVSGTTQIVRTKTTQTEVNEKLKELTVYDIRWIDDCTYEISNGRIVSGKKKTDKEEMNWECKTNCVNVSITAPQGSN